MNSLFWGHPMKYYTIENEQVTATCKTGESWKCNSEGKKYVTEDHI